MSKNKSLFWPQYWPAWLGVGILWLISKMPYAWQQAIGKSLGLLTMKILPSRARISRINIEKCFPKKTSLEIDALVRDSFVALGQGTIAAVMAWWASVRRIKKLTHSVTGLEHLEKAFANEHGVIILSAHFTSAEIGGRILALNSPRPFHVMHREQGNAVFERVLQKSRHQYLKSVILRADVRTMIRMLKANEGIMYLPDQNFEKEHSIFVPFMGVNTLTLTTTARFAKMNKCKVVPIFCFQQPGNEGFSLEIWPELENYPTGNAEEDAIRVNQIFEKAIKQYPAQYMWAHRRFKIRPEGEASFYD